MSFFEKFIHFLQYEIERPQTFGVFHLAFLAATIIASVLLVIFFKDSSDKTLRRILFGIWIVMVLLEVYKQLVFSMHVTDGVADWNYQWYAFPFQFCSTPLYALPFIIFLKEGWLRESFIAFFASFSLFAGIAVMIYPNDVFIGTLGINIQTMVHHGSQVAIGVLVAAHKRKRTDLHHLFGSLMIFYGFTIIAIISNISVHNYFVANQITDESFNMFFISPYYPCTLPVLSSIYAALPYPAFLAIYIIGFALVAAIFFGIERGIYYICRKVKKIIK